MNDNHGENSAGEYRTPIGLIIFVWALALVPLAWGFVNTLVKAAKLFT